LRIIPSQSGFHKLLESGTPCSIGEDDPVGDPEFDMAKIERGITYIVRLPKGRMMEVEWLESDVDAVRVLGFTTEAHYRADEEYRMAGFQPQLRDFWGHIPMRDF
jgi:hypothetical protein